jgi:hypothetical protein
MRKMKKLFIILVLSYAFAGMAQEPLFEDALFGSFKPSPGEKYIVSCWVKETNAVQVINYTHSGIRIEFLMNMNEAPLAANSYFFLPSGKIIDGWQRISGIIAIPPKPTSSAGVKYSIRIKLMNTNTDIDTFFDDVRFFPYNGNLKSFVYNQETQKLMAELDENNYATFYEYDQEGGLIRVKKETEKGIYTIQETRSSSSKSITH